GTTSVYVRIPFAVSSPLSVLDKLQLKYDDGFVAYLNGQRIASANAPQSLGYQSTATGQRADSVAAQFADFALSDYSHLLQQGTNVLAIHLLNVDASSSDLLISPQLTLKSGSLIEPAAEGYL